MRAEHLPSGLGATPDVYDFLRALPVRDDLVVLDAGFGDGRLRPWSAPRCRWIGIDIDADRVAHGARQRWTVLRSDLTTGIPLRSGAVDGVVLSCVLNVVPRRSERAAVVREVARVLRPGGVVWIRDFVRLPEPDARVEPGPRTARWQAWRRRYDVGRELAAWVAGCAVDELCPGSFPAFDIGPDEDPVLFGEHRYTAERFRAAVRAGRINVPFLACHPTRAEIRSEWLSVGEHVSIRAVTAQARGGDMLPVDELLVRFRGSKPCW
ncbi:MAG TPA: class I SAM-dependent methyltransferase [Pseudonocardiaceae bacterium]|nr:class I SAM-dependent methyltransferase [Pseudonocardiaceae bacterium]